MLVFTHASTNLVVQATIAAVEANRGPRSNANNNQRHLKLTKVNRPLGYCYTTLKCKLVCKSSLPLFVPSTTTPPTMDHSHEGDSKEVPLPDSYTQLRCFHVPESSKDVTPVVIVQLHRPKNYNAFTNTLMQELLTAFELFDLDNRIKVVVLTGSGKMFCAGADLDIGFSKGLEHVKDNRDGGGRVSLAIHRCRKPTIAAIHGSAVGVGITMTLPCTIRLAYEKAKIGFVFARRGIIMEACSSFFLPKLVGLVLTFPT